MCMLRRDDPDTCTVVSGDHDIYSTRGRLQLLRLAVLPYRTLAIQHARVPSDAAPLGRQLEFAWGRTITIF